MDYLSVFRKIVTEIDKRKKMVTNELPGTVGTLQTTVKNGKRVIYSVTYKDGKRIRQTITDDEELQAQIALRIACEEEIRQLNTVRDALVRIGLQVKQSEGLSDFNRQEFLKSRFPWLSKEVIRMACTETQEADAWANEPFEQSAYKPELKTKLTSRGLYVRSKSEVLIAEKLYEYRLPFRYEQIVHVGNAALAPDFTIRRNDGKLFYWEHEGLTNSREYTDRQLRKHALYAAEGIVPWDNLILTYDSKDGDIDLRIIESEIRNKLVL